MADVYRRCGCRDENHKLYGTHCPRLKDSKHGTWTFRISAGRDPKTGKRVQVLKGGFHTKKEAQAQRALAVAQYARGSVVSASKQPLGQYLDVWLKQRQASGHGLKATTVFHYGRYIHGDIQRAPVSRVKLCDLRRHHLNAFIAQLTADGRGATTVRRIAAVLQSALHTATRDELIDHNPAAGLRLPVVRKPQIRAWEPAQVGVFLDIAAAHRLGSLFEVAVLTGLRRGELLALHWEDVNLASRTLAVHRNRTQAGLQVVENDTTKTHAGMRTVDLDDRATAALIAWQLAQRAEADAWGNAYAHTGHVFTYENGEPLKPQYVTRLFQSLRTRADLPELTFHGLRHVNAALMIAAGTDIAVISKRLGHSSISVTSDIYGSLIGSASRQAAENAASLIPPATRSVHTVGTHAP